MAAAVPGKILGLRTRLVHGQITAVQVRTIHGVDGGLGFLRRAHRHESEAAGPAARAVNHQIGFQNRAVRRKSVLQIVLSRVEGDVSYKQFCVHVNDLTDSIPNFTMRLHTVPDCRVSNHH